MSSTLHQHARFRIFPRKSDKLAIFFSGSSTPDHAFEWLETAQRIDASAIVVSNGRNQWYQAGIDGLGRDRTEVTGSFRNWAKQLGARSLYTVGAAMGGTGALLHGVPLGARVLAFSCETQMDLVGGDVQRSMEKGFTPPVPDLRPMVEKAQAPIFLYAGESDPVDLYSARNLADLPNVFADSLHGVQHDLVEHLNSKQRLAPLIDAFLNDQHLPPFPEGGWGLEEDFAETLYTAHRAGLERRWSYAIRTAHRACSFYPRSDYASYLYGKGVLRLGKFNEAETALTRAVNLNPALTPARMRLARTLERMGRLDEAAAAYDQISDHPIFGGRANFALGQLHARRGNMAAAISCFRKAVAMDPQRNSFRARLQQLEQSEATA